MADEHDWGEYDPTQPRGRYLHPTSAGMVGFIFSAVSLGLLIVVAILWFFLSQDQEQGHNERQRWMFYWFLFLDLVSFLSAVIATVLSGRALSPSNPLYRGFAVMGLILGILEIVLTMLFGLIMTCCAIPLAELGRQMG